MNNQAGVAPDVSKAALDPIFPRLVKEDDTPEQKLVGFIAFGLFEEARREWASDFQARESRYPLEHELRTYERSWTATRLEGLRNAAVQLVAAYADTIADQLEVAILRSALRGRFWRGVLQWLFSAVLYTIAAVSAIVVLERYGFEPIKAMQELARPVPAVGSVAAE